MVLVNSFYICWLKKIIEKNMENQENQLNIELSEEIAEGVYSNLAIISHSSSEFVIDFVRIMPGTPKAPVKSRVVLAPEHAKRLLFALQDNISKYEQQNGTIRIPDNPFVPQMPMGFGGGEA
jgi:Protein of unknown function (DUF3467)